MALQGARWDGQWSWGFWVNLGQWRRWKCVTPKSEVLAPLYPTPSILSRLWTTHKDRAFNSRIEVDWWHSQKVYRAQFQLAFAEHAGFLLSHGRSVVTTRMPSLWPASFKEMLRRLRSTSDTRRCIHHLIMPDQSLSLRHSSQHSHPSAALPIRRCMISVLVAEYAETHSQHFSSNTAVEYGVLDFIIIHHKQS